MTRQNGFTLVELLVSIVLASIVTTAAMTFFGNVKRTLAQEELAATIETNLRWGMNSLLDNVRYTGYGVPDSNLSSWIPWVTGFTSNPWIVQGSGSDPDTLTVARCTSEPVTTVATDTTFASWPFTLPLTSAADLNTTHKRLLLLDNDENVQVTAINGNTVTLDADPLTGGNQAPGRSYPQGTPVCRVEVLTFDVDTANDQLRLDKHDGNGPQVLLDGIEDLQIDTLTAGAVYRFTLTARSLEPLPGTGAPLTRTLSTVVKIR